MRLLAGELAATGRLRSTLSIKMAADILSTMNSPELYLMLVEQRGWSQQQWSRWVGDAWVRLLSERGVVCDDPKRSGPPRRWQGLMGATSRHHSHSCARSCALLPLCLAWSHCFVRGAALLLMCACSGVISTPPGVPPITPVRSAELDCSGQQAMRVPTQRLSASQYERVVRDALGDQLRLSPSYPSAKVSTASPYSTFPEANPPADFAVKGIAETAEVLADAVTDGLGGCDAGGELGCARATLTGLATKLYRRPPTAEEVERLTAVFSSMRGEFTYTEALGLALTVMLQQPQTLYMIEHSLDAGTFALPLEDWQLAQRMALLYLGGLPDAQLHRAAVDGGLTSAAARKAEASRLVSTPRGRAAMTRFIFELLGQEGFVAGQFSPTVQAALNQELAKLVDDALAQPDGLTALLTSKKGFVNDTLETFYSIGRGPKDAQGWREVQLDARAGILTHPLLMARTAHGLEPSVIFRGKFVRTMLLCGELAAPPPGATAQQPDAGLGAGPRAASEARGQAALCAGCHTQMDPIGFGFLQYDGAGALRPAEDAHGTLAGSGDATDGTFNGARELGQKLAASEDVARCFSRQWLRYAFGKREDAKADVCAVKLLGDRFVKSGRNLEVLFTSVAELEAFALRRPEPAP